MSEALKRRAPLALATIAIWVMSFSVWTWNAAFQGYENQLQVAARGFVCDAFGAVACGGLYLILQRLAGRSLALRLAAAAILALAATLAYMLLIHLMYYVYDPLWTVRPGHVRRMSVTGIAVLWTFLTWCGIYFSWQLGADLREREVRLQQAQAMAVDAQNRMLRY